MNSAAIYARKSTESEDRQVLSIDSQVKELREHAKSVGLAIGRVFKESKSAKSPGRPYLSELLQLVQGGQVDTILCWKLDRLARNPVDGGAVIWALEENRLTRIVTPQREFVNTGNDKFWMQLEFGMAKKYVDDLSDNVKRGLRAKVEQGWQPGIAPLGYLNDKATKEIVKDPQRFPLLRRMWDLMLTGNHSPREIHIRATRDWGLRTRKFRRLGGGPMARSGVYEMFQNPFYYGVFIYGGVKRQGAHEPMVTKDEFDRVQLMMESRSQPRPKRLRFTYTGLIRCGECGASITAENKRKLLKSTGKVRRYVYYHCTKKRPNTQCSQKVVELDDLELQILGFLSTLRISKAYLKWVLSALNSFEMSEKDSELAVAKSLNRRLNASRNELSELTNMRVRGLIGDEEFKSKRNELQDEISGLQTRVADAQDERSKTIDLSRKAFQFVSEAMDKFLLGDEETKRAILNQVGSNRTLVNGKLLITAKRPYEIIRQSVSRGDAERQTLEPEIHRLDNTRTTRAKGGSCALLGVVDDVRTAIREVLSLEEKKDT